MSLKVVARNFIKIRETKKRFNLQNLTILVSSQNFVKTLRIFHKFENSEIQKIIACGGSFSLVCLEIFANRLFY